MGIKSIFDCQRAKSSNTAKNIQRQSWDYGKSGRCVGYTIEVSKIVRNVNQTFNESFFTNKKPETSVPEFSSLSKDDDNDTGAVETKCVSSSKTSSTVDSYDTTSPKYQNHRETVKSAQDVGDSQQEQKNDVDSWLDSLNPARPRHEPDTEDTTTTTKRFVTTRDVGVNTIDHSPVENRTDITKKEEQLRQLRFWIDKLEQVHQELAGKSSDSNKSSPNREIGRLKCRMHNPPAPSHDQEVMVLECDSASSAAIESVSEPTTNSEKRSSPIPMSIDDSFESCSESSSINRDYHPRITSKTDASSPSCSMICHASSSADFSSDDSSLSSMNLDLLFERSVKASISPDITLRDHHSSSSTIDKEEFNLLFSENSVLPLSSSDKSSPEISTSGTRGHSSSSPINLRSLFSDESTTGIATSVPRSSSSSGENGIKSAELSSLRLYSLFEDATSEQDPSRCQMKTEPKENGPSSDQLSMEQQRSTEPLRHSLSTGKEMVSDNRLNNKTAADTWLALCYDEPIKSMIRSSEENNNNSDPSAGIVEIWSEILNKLGKEKASKVQGKRVKAQRKRRRRRNKNVKTVWRSYK